MGLSDQVSVKVSDRLSIKGESELLERVILIIKYLCGRYEHILIQLISFQVKLIDFQMQLQAKMSFKAGVTQELSKVLNPSLKEIVNI